MIYRRYLVELPALSLKLGWVMITERHYDPPTLTQLSDNIKMADRTQGYSIGTVDMALYVKATASELWT